MEQDMTEIRVDLTPEEYENLQTLIKTDPEFLSRRFLHFSENHNMIEIKKFEHVPIPPITEFPEDADYFLL